MCIYVLCHYPHIQQATYSFGVVCKLFGMVVGVLVVCVLSPSHQKDLAH